MADLIDDKPLEKLFLTELESLEHFRISYTGLFREAPLGREDPDVRRLIEALAFFSARTRQVGERAVNESLLQLFRQYFPYLLSPLPAMALLRANVSSSFADAVTLPRGVEVLADARAVRPGRPAYRFRTLGPLRVLPVRLEDVRPVIEKNRLRRLVLQFASLYPRTDSLDELTLLVDHLNDLPASMAVFFALKKCLRAASVVWGRDVAGAPGQPCEFVFGAPSSEPHEFEAFESPVERFRLFLHFPQGELFVRFRGLQAPRNWQHASICLDLDEGWPLELSLTRDSFGLNVVPMANLKRDMADPIEHDGTRERHLLRHPDGAARYVLHSLLGVYRLTDQGMEPLEPGILGPTRLGYESAFEGKDAARRAWLLLELPDAFERPERVAVEASWTQPDLIGLHADDLQLRLAERHLQGVTWGCSGALVPPSSNDVEDRRDELLALTGLKGQRQLSADDLTFLLRALGALQRPEFARLLFALGPVQHRTRPAAGRTGGLCQVYDLTFSNLDTSDLPALDLLCGRLLHLLQSWSAEQVVELAVSVPRLGHIAHYVS